MLRRGLQTLDELDKVKKAKRKEEEARQTTADSRPKVSEEARASSQPIGFLSAAKENPLPFFPSFWDNLDFVGRTALEASSS